ncbi:MAG: glycosyltransferase family 8 protein [Bacteroidia bacterium]
MNIVCATDDNFVQHCCIMLTSVLINNTNVNVYLLTEGLLERNIEILKNEVENKKGKFHIIVVDSAIIGKFPMPNSKILSHISQATYYRLLISDILPSDLKKVIYLDCDIIVRKSLDELWSYDISGFSIGAVHQIGLEIEDANRLKYPVEYGYFNAGVLLINMDYWRKNKVSEQLFRYLVNNFEKIRFHDQDALNAVLHDSCFTLPCKWNMLGFFFDKDVFKTIGFHNGILINDFSEYKSMILEEIKDPTLIHYVFKPKPWQSVCLHPYRNEYFKYAELSLNYSKILKPNKLLNFVYFIYIQFITILIKLKHLVFIKVK